MKVQADTASGVYAVKDFGESVEVMTEALFVRCLRDLPEGDVIGSDLGQGMVEQVIREYGIAARPGGAPLASAAQALGRKGGSVGSEAQKAAHRAAGKAPVKPGSAPRGRPPKAKA